MYLSRIEFQPRGATARDIHLISSAGGIHKLVWSWFGDDDQPSRDFLFRTETGTPFRIYTLSAKPPQCVSDAWCCDSKPYDPQLREGDRLQFVVAVNPTFRAKNGSGAGKRHDVVIREKHRLREAGASESENEIVQRTVTRWLIHRSERLGCYFEERSLFAEQFRVERFHRGSAPPAALTKVDVRGTLAIRDPSRFHDAVIKGVGPGKAFGCGLLLIRRA